VIREKWAPCLVVSLIIFDHHKKAVIIRTILNINKLVFILFENPQRIYDTIFHEIIALTIGHGLGVIM